MSSSPASSTDVASTNALGYPKLQPQHPVPTDIQVSQQIVQQVGLLPLSDLAQQ
jgi:hypothetical protein